LLGATPTAGTYTLLTCAGGFVGAPDLRWSSPASSNLRATFDFSEPGRIQLILAAPNRLDLWRAEYFGNAPSPELAADTADPDGDSLPNLLEYTLGGDPLVADSEFMPQVFMAGDRLRLTFTRISDPDLLYQVEATDNLETAQSWQSIWRSTGAQNTSGFVSVDDTEPISAHSRRFLRLRVTR
jgi:hypothetical protein